MSDTYFVVKMVNPTPNDLMLMTQLCRVLDCQPKVEGPKTSRNRGRRPLALAVPPPAEDPADPIESFSDEDAPPALPAQPVSPASSCSSQELMVPMDVVSSSGDDPPSTPPAQPMHGYRWSQAMEEALERYRSEAEQDEE